MTAWCLVVEDEPFLAEMIRDNLVLEGYGAEVVADGESALARIRAAGVDLVILDVMLPGMDGFSLLSRIRSEGIQVPVLILSARSREEDRIRGLELAADDYLTKPFHLKELLLRVHALLRRARPAAALRELEAGEVRVDLANLVVRGPGDAEERLSEREGRLLRLLAGREGEAVSRREIQGSLFGDAPPNPRTLDNMVLRLRRLLGDDPRQPRFLHTLRGFGWRLTLRRGEDRRP